MFVDWESQCLRWKFSSNLHTDPTPHLPVSTDFPSPSQDHLKIHVQRKRSPIVKIILQKKLGGIPLSLLKTQENVVLGYRYTGRFMENNSLSANKH